MLTQTTNDENDEQTQTQTNKQQTKRQLRVAQQLNIFLY